MARSTAKLQNAMRTLLPLSTALRTLRLLVLFTAVGIGPVMSAQSFVNGNFESGSTGWTGCTLETGTAPTYGGTGTGRVAEVDAHFSTSPSDDRILCQSISGFTIGSVYRIDFDATRRGNNTPPDPVSVTMTMDDALNQTITRTGGYAMVPGYFYFTASLTTHAFFVKPNFQGPFGMVFDNLSLTLVSALPINLVYFNAEAESGGVRLRWSTATEQNNDHFTVQRSIDGLAFEDVLHVDGAGSSQLPLDYSAVDLSPIHGLAYYRLKQTDAYGMGTLLQVVSVQFSGARGHPLTVYPNPSVGGAAWLCTRNLDADVVVPLSITDQQGHIVLMKVITMRPGIPVDLTALVQLRPGSYTVTVPIAGATERVHLVVL